MEQWICLFIIIISYLLLVIILLDLYGTIDLLL